MQFAEDMMKYKKKPGPLPGPAAALFVKGRGA
jgi:hypothetical protein